MKIKSLVSSLAITSSIKTIDTTDTSTSSSDEPSLNSFTSSHSDKDFRQELSDVLKLMKRNKFSQTQLDTLVQVLDRDFHDYVNLFSENTTEIDFSTRLEVATQLLHDYKGARDIMKQNKIKRSQRERIFGLLDQVLRAHLVHPFLRNHAPLTLNPAQASEMVHWIDAFLEKTVTKLKDQTYTELWTSFKADFVKLFVRGIRIEFRLQLWRAWDFLTEEDIRETTGGHLVTSLASDIEYMFQQQRLIAKEYLPGHDEHVINGCNTELQTFVGDIMMYIGRRWKDMSLERFCALINDFDRLVGYCEEHNGVFLVQEGFVENGDALLRDLAELGVFASQYLSERVVTNNLLESVGSADWEHGDVCILDSVLEDFVDSLNDLNVWIESHFFFAKILTNSFDLTVRAYISSFFSNTIRGVKNAEQVSTEISEDYIRFLTFFNGPEFEEYWKIAGYLTADVVNDRLRVIQSIGFLVDPFGEARNLRQEIASILSQITDGETAVLHLIGLRGREHVPSVEAWLQEIASLKQEFEERPDTRASKRTQSGSLQRLYSIPDLKNSVSIQSLRLTAPDDLGMSQHSREMIQSTVALLRPRSPVMQNASRMFHSLKESSKLKSVFKSSA